MTTGISTHVLENVALLTFKSGDKTHVHLADLSERCHQAAAQLWGIDDGELAAIQQALDDMKKVKPGAKVTDADTGEAEEEGAAEE